MKILVTNPTGRVGRRIVPELLAPEFSLRVIARHPERLAHEVREQAEVICGSSDDAVTLRRALEDVEALFWCIPTGSRMETDVEKYYERFAFAAWQAIRAAQTPRVVTISADRMGAWPLSGIVPGLTAMEEILNESGAALRHLRCGFFMENLLSQLPSICERGLISYPMSGEVPISMTAVTDIADAALQRLVRRDWDGIQAVAVHGPERLSFNQATAVLERVLKRPLRYQRVSADQYLGELVETGASAAYARYQVETLCAMTRGLPDSATRSRTGTLTTLAAWAQEQLLPLVESFHLQSENSLSSATGSHQRLIETEIAK